MRTMMFATIMLFGLISMVGVEAYAQPYLVSDPQIGVTTYRMRLSADNGATWGAWAEGPAIGNAMRFNMATVSAGNYKGEAQAGKTVQVTDSVTGAVTTVTDWSPSAPFALNASAGNAPKSVRVTSTVSGASKRGD